MNKLIVPVQRTDFKTEKIKTLDHGYVQLVETWGSDERIVEAARMSVQKGFLGWGPKHSPSCGFVGMPDDPQRGCTCGYNTPGDEKLLRFMMENHHGTPFEMAGAVFEIQAPIMVFREWHRHRTQSYNEMSARYEPLPDVNYTPTVERLMMGVNPTANKQAGIIRDAEILTHERALDWLVRLEAAYSAAESVYQTGLKWGIPKELARLPVPVGRFSRMRASANLRNWMLFLTLRSDRVLSGSPAQWEIRQNANVVHDVLKEVFERTLGLFDERGNRKMVEAK